MIQVLIIVIGLVGAATATCPASLGHYCPAGATEQVPCPAGSAVFAEGLTTEEACLCQQVFAYTGGLQTYTIPAGVTAIVAHMWGAGGGGGTSCERFLDAGVFFLNLFLWSLSQS